MRSANVEVLEMLRRDALVLNANRSQVANFLSVNDPVIGPPHAKNFG